MPELFGMTVSGDVYDSNRHLLDQPKEPKTPARKDLDAELRKRFAATFEATWRLLNGPAMEREYRFCPDRDWRADYRIGQWLIELDGGVWTGGRHVRGKGYIADCLKLNTAELLGFHVIRIPTGMATAAYLAQIIEKVR